MWCATLLADIRMRSLPRHSGEYLFEVIRRRYENCSAIMTCNRPLEAGASSWPTSQLPGQCSTASSTTPR